MCFIQSCHHFQQQIIPEPRPHEQQQPPNLIKSEMGEAAIVFYAVPPTHTHTSRQCRSIKIKGGRTSSPPPVPPLALRRDVLIKSLLLLTVRWLFNRIALLCHFSFSPSRWNFIPLFCWCCSFLFSYFLLFMAAGYRRQREKFLHFGGWWGGAGGWGSEQVIGFCLFLIICFREHLVLSRSVFTLKLRSFRVIDRSPREFYPFVQE